MKTMKMLSKRTLATLLVFTMCFSMMHLSVYAAEAEATPDFTLTMGEEPEDLNESAKISEYLDPSTYVLSWSSSDSSVAMVEGGVVTPVGAGTAIITCEVSLTEEAAEALAGAQSPELAPPELEVPETPDETVPGTDIEDNTNTDADVEDNTDTDADVEDNTDTDADVEDNTNTDADVEDNTDTDADVEDNTDTDADVEDNTDTDADVEDNTDTDADVEDNTNTDADVEDNTDSESTGSDASSSDSESTGSDASSSDSESTDSDASSSDSESTDSDASSSDSGSTDSDASSSDSESTGSDASSSDSESTGSDVGSSDSESTDSDASSSDSESTDSDASSSDSESTGSDASSSDSGSTGSDASSSDSGSTGSDASDNSGADPISFLGDVDTITWIVEVKEAETVSSALDEFLAKAAQLPDEVNEENYQEVGAMLEEILALFTAMSEEEQNDESILDAYMKALSLWEQCEDVKAEILALGNVAMIGETEYETLQAAIDAVQTGETIVLNQDITEDISSTNKSYTLDMGGHTVTGTGMTHVFTIKNPNGGTVTLKNGTITGGKALVGGGIFAYSANFKQKVTLTLNLEDCIITGNTATKGYGGGISLGFPSDTSTTNITASGKGTVVSGTWKNVQVVGNTGNGVHIAGGNTFKGNAVSSKDDLTFSGVIIRENSTTVADNNGNAGGLNLCGTTLTATDCVIEKNTGNSIGGVFINCYSQVMLGEGVVIQGNKGKVGGLQWGGGNVAINGAVIKNNIASSGNYAGVLLKGLSTHTFSVNSGAIYANGTGDNSLDIAIDTWRACTIKIIAAKQMSDPEVSSDRFTSYGYVWKTGDTEITGALSHTAANTKANYKAFAQTPPANVAETDGKGYPSLAEAVAASETGSITLAFTGDSKVINSQRDTKTIEVSKTISFDLAVGNFQAAVNDLFQISEGGNLTLTGSGMLQGNIIVDGGSLTLEDQTNLSTLSSIIVKSGTATVSGAHDTLNVTLAQSQKLTATEGFTAKRIVVTLDQATLKEMNGPVLRNDVILVSGLTAEAAAALVANVAVNGLEKDSNTSITVDDSGNIVLRKSDMPGVYLGGANGSDENSGLNSKDPVATFAKALEIANANGFQQIQVVGIINVSGSESWNAGGKTLVRYPSYTNALVNVTGKLTLADIVIDGGGKISERDDFHASIEGEVTASQSLIRVDGGDLIINSGAVLQNNMVKNPSELANGGAVTNNGGNVYLMGGEIQYNIANYGGGIYNNSGSLMIQGGKIHDNTAEGKGASGGGVVIMGGKAVMSGGEIYKNDAHATNASGGGVSVGGINHLLVKGSPSFEMVGGTIRNNVSDGVGGGISAYHGHTSITKGDIIGNSARGNRDYMAQPDSAFAGGGIYVEEDAVCELRNVEVTGNKKLGWEDATVYTISCCPTSDVTIHVNDGMVMHDNDGKNNFFVTNITGGVLYPNVGPTIAFSRYMLGGGLYNWTDGKGTELTDEQLNRRVTENTGGAFYGVPVPTQADINRAKTLVEVRIADNTAGGRYTFAGAAIGCNGTLVIGTGSSGFEIGKTVVGMEDDKTEYPFQISLSRQDGSSIFSNVTDSSIDSAMGTGNIVAATLRHVDGSLENLSLSFSQIELEGGKLIDASMVGLKNGEKIVLKNLPNGTLYTVSELDSNGAAVSWSVPGKEIQSGTTVSGTIESVYTSISCTNSFGNLKIEKVVVGGPDSVKTDKEYTFTVKGPESVEGIFNGVKFVKGEATVTIIGEGSKTIEYLTPGEYTVIESNASIDGDYIWTATGDGKVTVKVVPNDTATATITNTYKEPEKPVPTTTQLTVVKEWKDEDNAQNTRPESIKVQLLRNGAAFGSPVTLNASNNWSHTWDNLATQQDDVTYTYTVEEVEVPDGYSVSYSGNVDRTVTVTNTLTPPESGKLTIVKEVSGGGSAAAEKVYTFTVTGPDGYTNTVTITGAGSVTVEGLEPGQYTVTEENASLSGYRWTATGDGVVSAEVKANETTEVSITNTYTPDEPGPGPRPDPDPDPDPDEPNEPDQPDEPEVPDPDVPLTDLPEEPETEIPDEEPPLAETPEKPEEPEEEIPDPEVPLADVPETGDGSLTWYAMALLSAAALAVASLLKKKDSED